MDAHKKRCEMLWTLVSLTCIVILVRFVWIQRRFAALIDRIPGPKTIPIVGNTDLAVPAERLFEVFTNLHRCYGDIYRTWQGSRPVIHLFDPHFIEAVLSSNKHIRKGKVYRFLLPWLGTGLLISDGFKWFSHRKLITPTFHFKILEGFIDIFNEKSQILVEKLHKKCLQQEYFDIYPMISRCALDIICETAMGTSINAMDEEENPFVNATIKVSEAIAARQVKLWLHPDITFNRTKIGRQFHESVTVLHKFTDHVIRERRKSLIIFGKNEETEGNVWGEKRRCAFLDLLLQSSEFGSVPLTDFEIREEVDTFMFEGHDTTTAAMSWALLLLANHTEIQEAARQEVMENIQDRPTATDLTKLRLLERIIREALRLFPSVPIITRELDSNLVMGEYEVPAKANVAIHIFGLHRNPKVFPDPHSFVPDRFLPENSHNRNPYAYLPFSAGPRNCIGQKFAMYEEKIILSSLLKAFRLESSQRYEDVTALYSLVCRPKNGIQVKLIPILEE